MSFLSGLSVSRVRGPRLLAPHLDRGRNRGPCDTATISKAYNETRVAWYREAMALGYQVVVTFDLEDVDSGGPYDCVRDSLATSDLLNFNFGSTEPGGDLPHNTFLGDLQRPSSDAVLQHVLDVVSRAFRQCEVKGLTFVAVGGQPNVHATCRLPR